MKKEKPLRQLILDIRKSKTAAEERKIIEREKALIRADNSNIKVKPAQKCLNVSKLILIDMLGHDSTFGLIECIRLASSEIYTHKRIGYLGICCLCIKSSDILLLCTSTIMKDMTSPNTNIVSLGLLTAASVGTADILISLQNSILSLFSHKENFIKYRAIGAAIALVKHCPETIPDVLAKINETLMESSSSVFRAVIVLFTEVLKINEDYRDSIQMYVTLSCGYLSRLIQMKNAEGLLDPMGISYFLKFLSYFTKEISGESERIMLDISRILGSSTKPCIKYEVAHLFTKCTNPTLNKIGNAILQSFLHSPQSNLKFCGLKICTKIADWDASKLTINLDLENYMVDPNTELRSLALSLTSKLITSSNVQQVIKSYLNCLMSIDTKFHQSIVERINDSLGIPGLDPVWHLDTVIRVAILAENMPEQMIFSCINLIRNNSEIQDYSVKKLFYAVKNGFNQQALVIIAFWAIGEFPEGFDVAELDQFLEALSEMKLSNESLMYMVNMLFKISIKVQEVKKTCCFVLERISYAEDFEIQQRACEYLAIADERDRGNFKGFNLNSLKK